MKLCSTKVKEVLNTFHESSYEKEQLLSDRSTDRAHHGQPHYFLTKEDSDSEADLNGPIRLQRRVAGDSDTSSIADQSNIKKRKDYFRSGVLIPASLTRHHGAFSTSLNQ